MALKIDKSYHRTSAYGFAPNLLHVSAEVIFVEVVLLSLIDDIRTGTTGFCYVLAVKI
jgi:hypothetical protein